MIRDARQQFPLISSRVRRSEAPRASGCFLPLPGKQLNRRRATERRPLGARHAGTPQATSRHRYLLMWPEPTPSLGADGSRGERLSARALRTFRAPDLLLTRSRSLPDAVGESSARCAASALCGSKSKSRAGMIAAKPLSYWETSPATFTPAAGLALYANLPTRNAARPTRAHGIQGTRSVRREAGTRSVRREAARVWALRAAGGPRFRFGVCGSGTGMCASRASG